MGMDDTTQFSAYLARDRSVNITDIFDEESQCRHEINSEHWLTDTSQNAATFLWDIAPIYLATTSTVMESGLSDAHTTTKNAFWRGLGLPSITRPPWRWVPWVRRRCTLWDDWSRLPSFGWPRCSISALETWSPEQTCVKTLTWTHGNH